MPHKRKILSFKDQDLWYLVGLIASDGNLSSNGRHINITAKDQRLLEAIKASTGLTNRVGQKKNGAGAESHQIQLSNKTFYDFLMSIGLTPKKSLTIGELKVPYKWFPDFLRGVIDGDGSIRTWIHPSNGNKQWSLRIYSKAPIFLDWLEKMIEERYWVTGKIHRDARGMGVLKFGKLAAKQILKNCYYENCLGLERKIALAETCAASKASWSKSKTTFCEADFAGVA